MGTGVTFPIWSPGNGSAGDETRPNPLVVEIDGIFTMLCGANSFSSNALQRLDYYRKRTIFRHIAALVSFDGVSRALSQRLNTVESLEYKWPSFRPLVPVS